MTDGVSAKPWQSAQSSLPASFVYFPDSQSIQAIVAAVEYLPTSQAEHDVAPAEASRSVTDPGAQSTQSVA